MWHWSHRKRNSGHKVQVVDAAVAVAGVDLAALAWEVCRAVAGVDHPRAECKVGKGWGNAPRVWVAKACPRVWDEVVPVWADQVWDRVWVGVDPVWVDLAWVRVWVGADPVWPWVVKRWAWPRPWECKCPALRWVRPTKTPG